MTAAGAACFLVAAGLLDFGGYRPGPSAGGPTGAPVTRAGNPALSSWP